MKKYTVRISFYAADDQVRHSNYAVYVPQNYRGEEATKQHAIYKAASENGHDQYISGSATPA